jgi:hypothetical protein
MTRFDIPATATGTHDYHRELSQAGSSLSHSSPESMDLAESVPVMTTNLFQSSSHFLLGRAEHDQTSVVPSGVASGCKSPPKKRKRVFLECVMLTKHIGSETAAAPTVDVTAESLPGELISLSSSRPKRCAAIAARAQTYSHMNQSTGSESESDTASEGMFINVARSNSGYQSLQVKHKFSTECKESNSQIKDDLEYNLNSEEEPSLRGEQTAANLPEYDGDDEEECLDLAKIYELPDAGAESDDELDHQHPFNSSHDDAPVIYCSVRCKCSLEMHSTLKNQEGLDRSCAVLLSFNMAFHPYAGYIVCPDHETVVPMQYFYAHITSWHKRAFSPLKQLTTAGRAAESHVSLVFKLDPKTQDGRTGIPLVLKCRIPGLPYIELQKCPCCQFVTAKTTSMRNHFYLAIKAEARAIKQYHTSKSTDQASTSHVPRKIHQQWSQVQHQVKKVMGHRLIRTSGPYTQVKTSKHVEVVDLKEAEEKQQTQLNKEIDSLFSYEIPGGNNTSLSTKWTADLGWKSWLEEWKLRSSQLGLSLVDLRSLISLCKTFPDEDEDEDMDKDVEKEQNYGAYQWHAEQAIQEGLVAFCHWLYKYMTDANSFLATCSPGVRAVLTANQ